jgi:hypothetical protein
MVRLVLAIILVILAMDTSAMAKPRSLLGSLVPAPPEFSVVYSNPQNAGGIDPATGQPFPAVGQYADINTNTVHTTRGLSNRSVAQDIGQLFGYSILTPGDRNYFSRLLGTDPANWENKSGANVMSNHGDEAFANYYSVAATGGLGKGESLILGETSIDPRKLRQFSKAISRLGKRRGLKPLNLLEALASAR